VAGGIGVAVLLARVFPREVLDERGWRLAFLVALPLGLVGLYLRLRLDETPGSGRWSAPMPSSGGRSPPPCAPIAGACCSALPPWPRRR
jgi:hypothetical protein